MICIPTQPHSTPSWHDGFLALLPVICRQAERAFRHLRPEAREDCVTEVVDHAMVAYARLVQLGKADLAYPTPLAKFGIRQVRDGRKAGSRHSVRDMLSPYAQ